MHILDGGQERVLQRKVKNGHTELALSDFVSAGTSCGRHGMV